MSRSHSHRSKVNAANARRWRRAEVQRRGIQWRRIGERLFFETPLVWIAVILLIIPTTVYEAFVRMRIRV